MASEAATAAQPARQAAGSLPQVLILGAGGRLGYACVKAFAAAGWQVLAQVRPGSHMLLGSSSAQHAQVKWLALALTQLGDIGAMHGPVQVVVNALAPPFSTRHWGQELRALVQHSVQVAQQTQALLINPLSVVPYGHALPPVLFEGQPLAGATTPRICALRARSEAHMQASAQASGVRVCTLRIGTLYGHAGWGWVSTAIAKDIQRGRVHWLGPYDVATPWAYVDDVAAAIQRIARHAPHLGAWTPLHFAGHQKTGADWLQAMQAVSVQRQWLAPGQGLRAGRVQWWAWRPATWVSPVIRALWQLQHIWRTPHALDNRALEALIGPEPRTPWLPSIAQTLALLERSNDLKGGLLRTHDGF